MPAEIDEVLRFSVGLLRDFGLKDFHLYLSTRPPQRVGAEEKWDAAEAALKAALERSGLPFSLNEGDGAFYGPKIDICVKDTLDRQWQLSTIQFDFNLPERFDLSFTDADGTKKRPYMIHRALCGSIERFFAILVEHFGGAFPTWLAPVQSIIVPVNESCEAFANELSATLTSAGFRTEVDLAADSFNKKIRNAVTQKVPNILIVGNKEVETRSVTLRRYCVKEQVTLTVDAFQERLRKLVDTRLMDNDPTVQVP
jgi:threonyl-tRNA synthetase